MKMQYILRRWRWTHNPVLGICATVFFFSLISCGEGADDRGPEERGDLFEQGVAAQEAGRWDEAVGRYDAVLEVDAEHAGARFNRGVVRLELEEADGAAADFEAVLDADPDDLDARLWLGSARLAQGEPAAAVEAFDAVLEAQPMAAAAYALRAQARLDLEQYEPALSDADAAVRLEPDDPAGWTLRADVLEAMGEAEAAQVDRSLAAVTQRIVDEPDDAVARSERGAALLVLDEVELALLDLTTAVQQLEDPTPVRLARGQAYALLELHEPALEDLSAVVEQAEARPGLAAQARLARAAVHEGYGNWPAAVEDYEALMERDDAVGVQATVGLARLRALCPDGGMRQADEAVRLAEQALQRFDAAAVADDQAGQAEGPQLVESDRWLYLDTQAAALAMAGEPGRAAAVQAQALPTMPEPVRQAGQDRLEMYREAAGG
jgi:tetratricopeptide (TPR) repeat protein